MKRSVRKQLLLWLVVPLGSIAVVCTVLAYYLAFNLSVEIFDRQLLNSADSVVNRIEFHPDGSITIDLPPAATNILRHNNQDDFYFQILGGDGRLLYGDTIIPLPDHPETHPPPYFRSLDIGGRHMRLALIELRRPRSHNTPIYLQVAETRNSRKALTSFIVASVALPQIVLILSGAVAIWYAVGRGLRPLNVLAAQVSRRSQWDLSRFDEEQAAYEARPLVRGINDLLQRLESDLESQRRFAANAAHQLRTPLSGLKTYTELAQKKCREPEVAQILSQLHTGLDRMTRLVSQLLSLSRHEPIRGRPLAKEKVELNQLASEVAAEIVPHALGRSIDLGFHGAQRPVYIQGDSTSLRELMTNMVDNAVRYNKQGGRVTIGVSVDEAVSIYVDDDGPGIPREEREHVFERFYRILGTDTEGSGLGLAIIKEIARAHGAIVSLADGSSGKGTLLTVTFPPSAEIAERA